MDTEQDITRILEGWNHDDPDSRARALELVYPHLKNIASASLARQGRATLQTTELVNEAYIRLAGQRSTDWQSRGHFFAIVARLIRRVVVDHVRRKLSEKRGSGQTPVGLDLVSVPVPANYPDWLDLDRAMQELEKINETAARVVDLRYIAGLNIEETAETLGIGTATVGRHWRFARSWLQTQLNDQGEYAPE
ncbi:MAG: ECF-type sigma factor [Xanthomonadales bacterium]|nr:ECF-type sigma factor [Xanthomonadales bacterium]